MIRMVSLGEIVEIKGGGTPDKSIESYWGGEIPWASVKDFKSGEITQTVDSITPLGVANSATNVIPAGSILVPTRMAVGKVAINAVDMAINQDLKALKLKAGVGTRYLLNALMAKAPSLEAQATGATVKGITLDVLRSLKIPLPPLEEQKRIAAILDQADDIRRKRQHAIERLNQLGQAIFHEMFGDPAMRTVSLGEVCQFQYGNSLPASIRDGIGYDVYGSNGVVGSHNEGLTTGPTVIIGRKGSVGEINFSDSSCWPIDTTYYVDSSSTQQNLRWLFYALKNLKLQSLNKATGVPGLNRNDAYRLEIPLPPLKEQKLFADRIKEIDVFMVRMAETLSANDTLFASLQHRAFTGQLYS